MPARILAVTPDPALSTRIASAVGPLGDVETYADLASAPLADTPDALWIIHLVPEPRLPADFVARVAGPVIVAVPRASLPTIVEVMGRVAQVVAVVSSEDVDAGLLAAVTARALARDGFGLAPLLATGARIHEITLRDHEDKLRSIAQVATFAEDLGLPAATLSSIEQCLDEMLMNALYDAPVDARGTHVFAGVPTSKRITRRTDHEVVLEYGADNARFAIAVRDAFGSLTRDVVLAHLHKGLHADDKVDRKKGGAGLGLYLIANASNAVYFTVSPGKGSEAVCLFARSAKTQQLAELGFFARPDLAAGATSVPARVRRSDVAARRLRLRSLQLAAAASVIVALGLFAWPRLFPPPKRSVVTFTSTPPGASIEIDGQRRGVAGADGLVVRDLRVGQPYTVIARLPEHAVAHKQVTPAQGAATVTLEVQALAFVELDSQPSGAAVEIDGKASGTTPMRLSLTPGKAVAVKLAKPGYRAASTSVQVPPRGQRAQLTQPLERDDNLVPVQLVSTPPGAEVLRDGAPSGSDRIYTPAEVFVEAGTPQRFTLSMPQRKPLVIEPFVVERGQQGVEKGGPLAAGP